jgi:ABC-type nitrate/sulfonate/bicarbonate transport system substrate-binding protein
VVRFHWQLLCFMLVLVASSPLHAQSKTSETIKIGYSGIGITHDLLKIMANNRIFEKHGLSAQSILFSGLLNQAAVSGSIDFTTSDLPSQIQAAVTGFDFKILSVTHNRLDGAMVTRKEIKKPSDLSGKKLAISRFGSVSDLVTRLVLRYWKLEPIKDVALLQVGNTPSRIAAILSGQVDGRFNPTDGCREGNQHRLLHCVERFGETGHRVRSLWRCGIGQRHQSKTGDHPQIARSAGRRHSLLQDSS